MGTAGRPRKWIATLVVALVLGACASSDTGTDTDPDQPPVAAGNAAQFCALWPDVRATLLGSITGETSFDVLGDPSMDPAKMMSGSDATLESADLIVPAELRRHWSVAYDAYTSVSDLLFVVGYNGDYIRPAHLAMAFGEGGHTAVVGDTEVAVAAIDDWAVTACGDFCSRWAEFEGILRYEEHFDPYTWEQNLDRYEVALSAGDRLAPEAVAAEWAIAADIQRRRMTMFRDNDYTLDVPEDEARRTWGVIPWDEGQRQSEAALARIQVWADANCDAVLATGGAPGSVSVRPPLQQELAGHTIMFALLPAGTDFADVRDSDIFEALWCTHVGEVPEHQQDMGAESLRPIASQGEYYEASLCGLIRHDEMAVVPGGAHELFVAAYIGAPGSYELYLGPPELCTQFPITVDGETTIDAPPLEPCDLETLGSAEEVARRTTPPTSGGRLWIEVDTSLTPGDYDFCRMDVVVLPAGTTLNQVGRGEAWPSGAVNFHQASTQWIDPGDIAIAETAGLVPVLQMPPSGTGEVPVFPSIRQGEPWDGRLAEPVFLVPGSYDVHVNQWCDNEGSGDESEDRWCAMFTVEVDGDTVVPLPDLEPCS